MTKLLISVVLSMIKYGEYQTSFWPVMKTSDKKFSLSYELIFRFMRRHFTLRYIVIFRLMY